MENKMPLLCDQIKNKRNEQNWIYNNFFFLSPLELQLLQTEETDV